MVWHGVTEAQRGRARSLACTAPPLARSLACTTPRQAPPPPAPRRRWHICNPRGPTGKRISAEETRRSPATGSFRSFAT